MKELIRKYTNRASRFAPVHGTLVHYRDEGKGSPLVLIHGAFSSLHTWDSWTTYLKERYRVIRYDLPGFGLTGPSATGLYNMSTHLQHLMEFLDMLGIEKFHVAGNSLGAWIAWECALRYPKRVVKLALLNSAGYLEEDSIPLPFRVARTPYLSKVVKYAIKKNLLEHFLCQVYYDERKVTQVLIDRYYDLLNRPGNAEAFLKLVKSPYIDHTRYLQKIQAPTLVMWGAEDQWIPVSYAERFFQQIPLAEKLIYTHCGHLPMEELPEDSAKDLHLFFKMKHKSVGV